jgi:Na+-transporting NADH:ubiquinone oxidoreductase subunit A
MNNSGSKGTKGRMLVNIKTGLDLRVGPAPERRIAGAKSSSAAAILGRDFPGVKFELLVDQGAEVKAGDPLLRDRYRPEIVFTSPTSGTVAAINRGPRRALLSLMVTADGEDTARDFDVPFPWEGDALRRVMLASGLWTAIRTRPFGYVPDPDGEPRALLITAIDTEPLSPDPALVIAEHAKDFSLGLDALRKITEAPVYLCQGPDVSLPVPVSNQIRTVEFSGPHPAGLPGTHIHALCPIGFGAGDVWHIGYQDAIALGRLLATGTPWLERVVSLTGPAVPHPRLLTVPLGAAVDALTAGELRGGAVRVISGSPLSGHVAFGPEAYLGRRHHQITVLPEAEPERRWRWRRSVFDTSLGGTPGPLIPTGDLERVAPPGILPVPFLRALLVGDVERARALGALELVEEDLALLSYVCPSKSNYGSLLRDVLDQLHREGQ